MGGRTVGVAFVAVVLMGGCAQRAGAGLAEQGPLEARQEEFRAALSARDADRVAGLFAESAVLHVANMPPIEGRGAIRSFYDRMFGFLSASTATPESTRISAGGDLAYTVGRSTNEFRGPAGPVTYGGKYVVVWEKVGDEWLIVLYGISSNQPDAGRSP